MLPHRFLSPRRILGALAAAAIFGGTITSGGLPVAHADSPVVIDITDMSPTIWHAGALLTMAGTVINQSGDDIKDARVVMWQSETPLDTIDALNSALTSNDTADPLGGTVPGATIQALGTPGATSKAGTILEAGASQSFTITGTPSLATADAAYLVGAQVLNAQDQVIGRARIIIGYQSQPVTSSLLVPLTAAPSLIQPAVTGDTPSLAVFANENLITDINGPLGQMLTLAEQPGATPLIDPALVDELTQMAAGYQVNDNGTLVDGQGQQTAQAALDRLNGLAASGRAYRLPYGNPDLNAMATIKGAGNLPALFALSGDDPLAALPEAVLMLGDPPTSAAQDLLTNIAPELVICDALDQSQTLQMDTDKQLWLAATAASTLVGQTGPAPLMAGPLQGTTARAARLIVASANNAPTMVVANDAETAQLLTAWLGEGWQPVPLVRALPSLEPGGLRRASPNQSGTLPTELTSQVARVLTQVKLVADLGADPAGADLLARRLLPTALSSGWGGQWGDAATWLQQASDKLDQAAGRGSVRLHVAGEWYLSSTNNKMPISVINDLGIPVQVVVRYQSENQQRLSVPASDPVSIDANSTASVIAEPQAHGNGSVQVTVQLYTVTGTRVGTPLSVQVITTSAGRLGWIIIVGSGAAFVVATSLRVRQVRRQRKLGHG